MFSIPWNVFIQKCFTIPKNVFFGNVFHSLASDVLYISFLQTLILKIFDSIFGFQGTMGLSGHYLQSEGFPLMGLSGHYLQSEGFPLVGLSGLEPPTSRLSGVRSNRLSYKPI